MTGCLDRFLVHLDRIKIAMNRRLGDIESRRNLPFA
jgi:hypothetical protein